LKRFRILCHIGTDVIHSLAEIKNTLRESPLHTFLTLNGFFYLSVKSLLCLLQLSATFPERLRNRQNTVVHFAGFVVRHLQHLLTSSRCISDSSGDDQPNCLSLSITLPCLCLSRYRRFEIGESASCLRTVLRRCGS